MLLGRFATRVAKPLLESALGAYLPQELDLAQLDLHVPDGRLRVRNLELNAEALAHLCPPPPPLPRPPR